MITFENIDQRTYDLFINEEHLIRLNLVPSSITNKFYIITDFVTRLSENMGEPFDNWLSHVITTYYNKRIDRYEFLLNNIPKLKEFVDEFIDNRGIDFTQFMDESKTKQSSIKFEPHEIERIIKTSCYLKVYSLFSNSYELKLDDRLHRKIYNEIAKDILEDNIVRKIFDIIRTKTFRYNITDRYMWDYIKMVQCKSINSHVIEIFNFIMNQILVLCEEHRNPITYFSITIEESVKWFLRSVYKGSIVYEDSVATEDIHSTSSNNLKNYSYNDTLGRLKGIAYEYIYDRLEQNEITKFGDITQTDELITSFQNRISSIEYTSPLCYCITFPMYSNILNIPYGHFKALSPSHSTILSIFLKNMMTKVFKDYKTMFNLMDYYPTKKPSIEITYSIKDISYFVNLQREMGNFFFGFKSGEAVSNDIIRHFIGKTSRLRLVNAITGEELSGVPLSKLEGEMIHFLTLFFSGKMNDELSKLKKLIISYF